MAKIIQPIIAILICQSAGLVGSFFTVSAIPDWYAGLVKPSFNPPNWVFGPAWLVFYTLMGIALYLVWQKMPASKLAVIIFLIHLAVNALWSIVFFCLKNPNWAFLGIIILWLMILALIILFYQIDKRASYLLFPYFAWVSFAAVLNFYIWRLN